ncbi:helix-turn-helix domain-containing protein [Aurantimicrobium minutum]|uniref:helix-turn-helix domain-containing protein n=1 Tax=Aurantimicrobium minutum TaxID=708131 RepID=UPI00248DCCA0|nr:helix-turn-helix transcriptional regulator [Aurantimicrobium minutum]
MGKEVNSPSYGIGKRLANYRRMANLSAQELSDATTGKITRTVISNIENGRKTDVSIDEVIHLSLALGIPPVALALPIEEPFKEFEISYGLSSNTGELMLWFQGNSTGFGAFRPEDPKYVMAFPRSTATAVSSEIINSISEYLAVTSELKALKISYPHDPFEEYEPKIAALTHKLTNLGIDLRKYPFQESIY